MSVGIAEDKSNRREEVAFAGAVSTDNDIVLGRERFDDRLVLVARGTTAVSEILI